MNLFWWPQERSPAGQGWRRRAGEGERGRERGLRLQGAAILGSGGLEDHGLRGEEMHTFPGLQGAALEDELAGMGILRTMLF